MKTVGDAWRGGGREDWDLGPRWLRMMMPETETSGGTGLRVSGTEEEALGQVKILTGS